MNNEDMEGGEEARPARRLWEQNVPNSVTAKSVLLADMIPSRPHTICWADSPLMAAGQWDPALTRQEFWRRNRGEKWRRGAFSSLQPLKCPSLDLPVRTKGSKMLWSLEGRASAV